MPATVLVNNLTVVHKGSGGSSVAGPDVCKTPTPGGPVPVPYVNTALSRHTARGSRAVRVDGHPIMLKSSHFSTSMGDEPGTLGGVLSGKFKGKAYPRMYSLDVKVEGSNVFRFTDLMLQNSGSPGNAVGVESQPNPAAVGAEPDKVKLVELRWSREELCCGDAVSLIARSTGADDEMQFAARVERTDASKPQIMDVVPVTLRGNRAEERWVSRWRYLHKTRIPARAAQHSLLGEEKSSNQLSFKNVPPAKLPVSPDWRQTPKYVLDEDTDEYLPNGETYAWEYGYELEIFQGRFIVRRKVDFSTVDIPGGVDARTWRTWKREIEAVWDRKFYFHRAECKRGRDCDCSLHGCCKFPLRVKALMGSGHGAQVDLFSGGPKYANIEIGLWWFSHTWWTEYGEAPTTVRAHEFGHLIGCYDEYPAGACHPSRAWSDVPTSIMNAGATVFERHIQEFAQWFLAKANPVVGRLRIFRM